jgi:GntR family transcriptional regulator / MocR family aminotransferase
MEPLFELAIRLPTRASRGLLRALHSQLRAAIINGRLKPGVQMPSTRALAASHGVSRNTVLAAYALLLGEGYLIARGGSGTYIAETLPRSLADKPKAGEESYDRRLNAAWRRRRPPFGRGAPQPAPRLSFQLGVPDIGLFPFDIWRRLSARALRRFAKARPAYHDPQGLLTLREAIAKHTSSTRAVACRPDDVVVTAGAQQAFDLLARTLVTPQRTVVAVENPGYPPLRAALIAAGAKVVPIPVDSEGLVVNGVPDDARIICVTPSHQFPLGTAMSMRRRTALLEFARARNAVVIEDDYDCEFRFADRPLDALQTLDRAACVFYVGTFSKSLFPAIRLGFVACPPWARRTLVTAKEYADSRCPELMQHTLAAFIAEGHLVRHVRKMRAIYSERRQALLHGLHSQFGHSLEPIPSAAGLHLAAFCKTSRDPDTIVERARLSGVGLYTLNRFATGKNVPPGLVFGYGAIEKAAITEGLTLLRRAW